MLFVYQLIEFQYLNLVFEADVKDVFIATRKLLFSGGGVISGPVFKSSQASLAQ